MVRVSASIFPVRPIQMLRNIRLHQSLLNASQL
ncbi:hypothetical protein NC653_015824 [Populus alba x Populus x berolinensis]|uniref:Uncharacterized protein n=1 Tax=Populus alba x Populus x berolinensis TaxID=444605 RepID=A0AAD6QLH6_9ROSI|nr:hypothetical protein NC653_015824 [Populus alba x Populus x berolinensis]